MSGRRRRRTIFGRSLLGACALALPLVLGGCLKGALPAPTPGGVDVVPPRWVSLTVNFAHAPVPMVGPTTGWVTTVTVPKCRDFLGTLVTPTSSVSNGTLVHNGGGVYTWTRVVTGAPPVTRVSGVFTADCYDFQGSQAHPTLSFTVT